MGKVSVQGENPSAPLEQMSQSKDLGLGGIGGLGGLGGASFGGFGNNAEGAGSLDGALSPGSQSLSGMPGLSGN